jgi:hypothetical protein
MDGEDIKVFHNDDQAYEDWVARHGGSVLTARARKSEYMLRDAECGHLGRDNDSELRLTFKPRRWAKRSSSVVAWTMEATSAKPLFCQSCM